MGVFLIGSMGPIGYLPLSLNSASEKEDPETGCQKYEMTSKRIYGRQDIKWDGPRLRLCTGRLLATVESDGTLAGMYRARLAGRHLTDMVNLSRAKDAAISLALSKLNGQETSAEASPMRSFSEAAE